MQNQASQVSYHGPYQEPVKTTFPTVIRTSYAHKNNRRVRGHCLRVIVCSGVEASFAAWLTLVSICLEEVIKP